VLFLVKCLIYKEEMQPWFCQMASVTLIGGISSSKLTEILSFQHFFQIV